MNLFAVLLHVTCCRYDRPLSRGIALLFDVNLCCRVFERVFASPRFGLLLLTAAEMAPYIGAAIVHREDRVREIVVRQLARKSGAARMKSTAASLSSSTEVLRPSEAVCAAFIVRSGLWAPPVWCVCLWFVSCVCHACRQCVFC